MLEVVIAIVILYATVECPKVTTTTPDAYILSSKGWVVTASNISVVGQWSSWTRDTNRTRLFVLVQRTGLNILLLLLLLRLNILLLRLFSPRALGAAA
jgi:hypothetical protein